MYPGENMKVFKDFCVLLRRKTHLKRLDTTLYLQNEIAEFLNDVIQPPKVVVSIITNSDSSKTTATVSSADAQLLKQILSGN